MKKFVITTIERNDRLALLTKELEEQGCHDVELDRAPLALSDPMQEISRRHKSLITRAYHEPQILIMEDDVKFVAPGALNRFLNLMHHLPRDWDLFLAGMSSGTVKPFTVEGIRKLEHFTGIQCYIVNKKFYDTFLQADERINLDIWLAKQNENRDEDAGIDKGL